MKKLFLTVSILLIFQVFVSAQMNVQSVQPFLPSSLANALAGNGIQISNVTFTGDTAGIGLFSNGINSINMTDGLVMSSGFVSTIGSSPSNTTGSTSGVLNSGSDVDLSALVAPSISNNSVVLEFDFKSQGDSVSLQMVFASEEYPEYVCSFNDAFGFFVSGPGMNGPYSNNAENIALIPGTNLPIAIGTVNGGVAVGTTTPCVLTNANFYVDNSTGNFPILFDGFTTVLNIKIGVIPDTTYHFKLGIGDANDQIFDSAIFIKGQSFSSNANEAKLNITTSLGLEQVNEQCGYINLGVDYLGPLFSTDSLELTVGGTAIESVDFGTVPQYLVGNTGNTSIPPVNIPILLDSQIEPSETIIFYLKKDGWIVDSATVTIQADTAELFPSLVDTTVCAGQPVLLDGSLYSSTTDIQTFTDTTNTAILDNSTTTSTLTVSNIPTTMVLESVCLDINHLWPSDLDIYLIGPGGAYIELSTDNGGAGSNLYHNTCFTLDATTPITQATSGNGNFFPEQSWSNYYGINVNGDWTLVIGDDAVGFMGNLLEWSLTFSNAISNQLTYTWQPSADVVCSNCATTTGLPSQTTTYIVMAQTDSNCVMQDSSLVTILATPDVTNLDCSTVTDSTITFSWMTDGTETFNEYSTDYGQTWTTLGAGVYSQTVSGLNAGEMVEFMVRSGNGICTSIPILDTCTTSSCSTLSVSISSNGVSNVSGGDAIVTTTGGTAPYAYTWSNGEISDSIDNLSAGVYTVTVSDALGCMTVEQTTICDTMNISFTVVDDTLGNDSGEIMTMIAGGIAPYTFTWDNGATTQNLTNLVIGNYICTVTDDLGCTYTATTTIGDGTNVQQPTTVKQLILSPNPTSDNIFIELSLTENLPLHISIIDITGKQLIEKDLGQNIIHQANFDLSDFANGIYIVQFDVNGEKWSRRVVVQK